MEANKENQHKERQGKDAQKPTQNPALREEMEYDEHGKGESCTRTNQPEELTMMARGRQTEVAAYQTRAHPRA
jgi:hypothetical protein